MTGNTAKKSKPEWHKTGRPQHQPALLLLREERSFPVLSTEVQSAREYLMTHGENLLWDGVYPRLPVEQYLDRLVLVLAFVHRHVDRFSQAHLGQAVCAAVESIALELQMIPDIQLDRIVEEKQVTHPFTATAALLLCAYREAIRHQLPPKGNAVVSEAFGLLKTLNPRDAGQVAAAMDGFLLAAQVHPDWVAKASITDSQLKGLASQRRVLVGWVAQNQRLGNPTLAQVRRARVLHAAIEYFFDRYAAIVSAKFLDLPQERLRGLRLVPRKPR